MNRETWISRLEKLPVPILATLVGAATLSNVYSGQGFPLIRHITMVCSAIVLVFYVMKVFLYPRICINEYKNAVPCSLYAGFFMLLMILGSYVFEFNPQAGKAIWFTGLGLDAVHILVFTWRNVIMSRNIATTVPSWFVTYNGIMVSSVVGGVMNEPAILTCVVYYGIVVYFILIPLMIWRLIRFEIKDAVYHTQAVVLAPCSLCLVSYLNIIQEPNAALAGVLYCCVLASLLFIIYKLPSFFSYPFTPGFAGMTFPMAIGIVASTKMAGFLENMGQSSLASSARQISGIQLYITTAIIGFVLLRFFMMLIRPTEKTA